VIGSGATYTGAGSGFLQPETAPNNPIAKTAKMIFDTFDSCHNSKDQTPTHMRKAPRWQYRSLSGNPARA